MLRQSIKQTFRTNDLLSLIIVGCMGLSLGISCILFSPLFVVGAVVLATFILYATLKSLEITLLGILIVTSSIVFEERLPLISIGSISFHIPDILLLGSLGLIALRLLVDPKFRIVRTPLDWPLLTFYGVTLLSTSIAILQSSVEVKEALRATRVFTYYLTFFIVTNLVRERRQLNFLLNSIFILATIVAAGVIGQFLLGDSVELLPGRAETLNTQGTMFEGVSRISPPGFSIVLVSFVTILCTLVLEKFKPIGLLKFVQCGFLGMALLITFLRSYYAVLILVILLLVYLVRGADRKRLIGWGMVVIFSAALILFAVVNGSNSRASLLLDASWHRLSTLGSIGTFQGQDGSVDWRKIENGYAFSAIASNPLIGLGMGARYRPWDSALDFRDADGVDHDFRRLIHNGHLTILLQSGLLGYLSLMWLSFIFLSRGFRHWRRIPEERMRSVALGFTLAYLAILIAAMANSTFMQWRWTPIIGIIMGINEVIFRKVGHESLID